jgi:tetratricopeptide (TPR) repeat protein
MRFHLSGAYRGLGDVRYRLGKFEEAVECYRESLNIGQSLRRDYPAMKHLFIESSRALIPFVECLKHLERTDTASDELANFEAQTAREFSNRGAAYIAIGQFEKAFDDFNEAIDIRPEDPSLRMFRGICHYKLGEYSDAMVDYESAIKSKPDFAAPLNGIAWLLAAAHDDSMRDGKRAVQLATKACELTDFKNADYVGTLATAYAEAGDFATSIKWSQKAIELAGGETSDNAKYLVRRLESYKASRPWRIAEDER